MPNNNPIKIDIERSGFPVTIGDVDLFFESTFESLKRFLSIDDAVKERAALIDKMVDELPDMDDPKNMTGETFDKATELVKAQAELSYDLTFGEGTFKRLYKKYPDVWALQEAYDYASIAIADRLVEYAEERTYRMEQAQKDALEKKRKKRS
jgi:hypothetical protein